MEFQWVTLKVKDLAASKAFYGDFLGLDFHQEFSVGEGTTIAFYITANGTRIELIESLGTLTEPIQGVSIGLATERYDEILEGARDQKILQGEPRVLGGYLECFFIFDPDGLSIQVIRKTAEN